MSCDFCQHFIPHRCIGTAPHAVHQLSLDQDAPEALHAALSRFSKKLENLEAAVAMFLAYYNFVGRTRLPEKSGQYRVPAAMSAGVVRGLWSFEKLYDTVTAA